tara:strand:- start:40 stop:534 length:495 start_codon:yes stop_codon:yes gene_type:complete
MIKKEVIDNFLPEDQFKIIENNLLHPRFPWNFVPQAYSGERAQLVHEFWNSVEGNISEQKQLTIPFINRLRPAAILRIKANLQPKNIEVYEDPLHVDLNKVSCTTSIFYVNTCNGYTYFEDGSKVESVANRLVTFPSQTKHAGTTCSDQVSRVVINFNYHKYYD